MNIDQVKLATEFKGLARIPPEMDVGEEVTHLEELLKDEGLATKLNDYGEPRAEGAGGSGLVISATYIPFGTRRALKFPRRRIYAEATGEFGADDPELHALSKVSHQNITRLYESIPLGGTGRGYCVITEYVEEPRPLDEFARNLCCTTACVQNDSLRAATLQRLARLVFDIADALTYMHEQAHLVHFDVKPDNVLVSKEGRAFVTDLGFARDLAKHARAPEKPVDIGFTWKYAHPTLTDPYAGGRVSRTPAKSTNKLEPAKLSPIFDVFAFGRTLQEVLGTLQKEHGDAIHSDYTFNYLHVLACLCLDGRNAANGHKNGRSNFASDTALGMPTAVFRQHKLTSFSEIKIVLERLLGMRRLEIEVPELDPWSSASINVSDLGITTLTSRVTATIGHPAVKRLSRELQLGMLQTVFPTATHTRLQHSLGVYHAVRSYLTALYYDPENPTFRILFSETDGCRALLAAIVHDIGQTSFGHELEEVDSTIFDHTRLASQVASSRAYVDEEGRTLKEQIEGTEYDCWGVPLATALSFFGGKFEKPIDNVFHDILDGQLDADKLDYLVRDSVECRVQYGGGIDHARLLRSLTTVAQEDNHDAVLRLAIKQKGAAAAEAFAFARYQLYQSLYWHHTFRATKAMFLTGASLVLKRMREAAGSDESLKVALRHAYLEHVLEIDDGETLDSGSRKALDILANSDEPPSKDGFGEDRTLRLFWKLSDKKERLLITDLMSRRYYKRIIEIPLSDFAEDNWVKLSETFGSNAKRLEFRSRIEGAFVNALTTAIQSQSSTRQSLVVDRVHETARRIAADRYAFLVDLPTRGWTAGGDEPVFVQDYKRRHFRSVAGTPQAHRPTIWSAHIAPMMRKIAVFRVFCEPALHRVLTRVLTPADVAATTKDVLQEYKLRFQQN